jgi:hypothetical protein
MGFIWSIVSPSLLAARKRSASFRSPQQIGFMPAQRKATGPAHAEKLHGRVSLTDSGIGAGEE